MPKVTFYTHVADREHFIGRLSHRAASEGRLLLWLEDEAQSVRIDRDLWREPPESFLPHEFWLPTDDYPAGVPVVLAMGEELPELAEDIVVLNSSDAFWCDAPAPPKRVLEIVGDGLEDLAAARDRFRAYRQRGFEIEHHNMQGKA